MMPWDLILRLVSFFLTLAVCWSVTEVIKPNQQPPQYWYGATETLSTMPPPTGSWTSFIWSQQDSLWTDSVIWADDLKIDLEIK